MNARRPRLNAGLSQEVDAAGRHIANACLEFGLKQVVRDPTQGKRMPELAAGILEPLFGDVCATSMEEIMAEHAPRLDAQQWQSLLRTWDAGKLHLWTGLQVKLDFRKRLPWRLAALAHHDLTVARRIATECMAVFDAQTPEVQALHHPRTLAILGHSSRPAMLQFVAGAQWDSEHLASLARVVLPMKFVPVVERYIEGGHSLVKRGVGPRHAPPLISLARRLPRFEQDLELTPELLPQVLSFCL